MAADVLCRCRRTVVISYCLSGLILVFANGVNSWNVTKEMVKDWANAIGSGTHNFTSNITGASLLKEEFTKFNPQREEGTKIVNQTKERMDIFFNSKLKALEALAKRAEAAYHQYQQNTTIDRSITSYPYHNMKTINDSLLAYDEKFETKVNSGFSGVHIPTDVYDKTPTVVSGIRWTEALDEVFKKNYENDPSMTWQYYGSQAGFFRMFPAKKWVADHPKKVDMYDARRRSWYIRGGSSPKNVIIIIDASGSMHGVPMKIAKLSAQTVIDFLEEDDFFNIVYFNIKPFVLLCDNQSNSTYLVQATKRNREHAKALINDIKDTNVAMWSLAMKKAFQLLELAKANNKGAECQQLIMVFSDGTNDELKSVFEEHNKEKQVRVFTYPVGPPAESTRALHRMACNNKGYFWRIQSVGVVKEAITENVYDGSLFQFQDFCQSSKSTNGSRGVIAINLDKLVHGCLVVFRAGFSWLETFLGCVYMTPDRVSFWIELDFILRLHGRIENGKPALLQGLGLMVSSVLPVFHRTNNTAIKNCLLGVFGADVALRDLSRFLYQPLMGANGYAMGVNNNGQVMLHPRLKNASGYLQDPAGVDLLELEFPLVENQSELEQLRNKMIDQSTDEKTFWVHDVSGDELRVMKRQMKYYYFGIDKTPFGFAIVTPDIGFKYTDFNVTKDDRVNNLKKWLSDAGPSEKIEKWPYCENVIISEDPVKELKKQLEMTSDKINCSADMLNGLWVDTNATASLDAYWIKMKDIYEREKIKSVFVRTHFGLSKVFTRSASHNATFPSKSDFARAVSGRLNNSVMYAAPHKKGNTADVDTFTAYQQVSAGQGLPAAVVGYEMDMDSFVKKFVNATVQAEGYFCYLLDENAFVVASNSKESIGKFFGEVSAPIMDSLLFRNRTAPTRSSLYHKFQFEDLQATCEVKSPATGGSSILKPLFSIKSYFEWWTTKAAWSLLYFNVYSWLFSNTGFVVEGSSSDVTKYESCVKVVTTYYAEDKDVLLQGSLKCSECSTDFFVSSIHGTNLYLLVAEASCVNCKDNNIAVDMPGGTKQLDPVEVKERRKKETCLELKHRKTPERCVTTGKGDSESGYTCGSAESMAASVFVILQLLMFQLLLHWTVITKN